MDRREQPLPVERDIAKIQLLYRIPTVPARGRVLELSVDGESILRSRNHTGEIAAVCVPGPSHPQPATGPDDAAGARRPIICVVNYGKALPFSDGSFDLVVLHRTLDQLSALAQRDGHVFTVRDFLARVAGVLSVGGIVAGCVENRHDLNHIVRRAMRPLRRIGSGGSDRADPPNSLSVPSCYRALAEARFEQIKLFSILPGLESPTRLLSIERGWSRRACKRQVEALRPLVGPSSYAVWRILAELGVSQYLGAATFFWGRKGC